LWGEGNAGEMRVGGEQKSCLVLRLSSKAENLATAGGPREKGKNGLGLGGSLSCHAPWSAVVHGSPCCLRCQPRGRRPCLPDHPRIVVGAACRSAGGGRPGGVDAAQRSKPPARPQLPANHSLLAGRQQGDSTQLGGPPPCAQPVPGRSTSFHLEIGWLAWRLIDQAAC